MRMPKPALVTIVIATVIVVGLVVILSRATRTSPPDQQGSQQDVQQNSSQQDSNQRDNNQWDASMAVQEFRQAHQDAFIIEVFGEGNFAPTIDQADDTVRIWCHDARGETTMTAAEFTAGSCQPNAAIGIYGGRFGGISFGTKQGAGHLHAVVHQWGTNKFQSFARMFMAFYSVKLPGPELDEWQESGEDGTSMTIAKPDLSETTTMENAFNSVVKIYGDLSGWNVERIENFAHAFESSGLRGDLSTWRTESATDMNNMFNNATSFDSDLSYWDVGKVTNMRGMFSLSGLSPTNMSAIMAGWGQKDVSHNVELGADDIYRCNDPAGEAGLHVLEDTYGWTVTHAGVAPEYTSPGVTILNQSALAKPGTRVNTAILEFDRDLKYWDSECVAGSPTESGKTRRLECQLYISHGEVWLNMWAKDRYNNTTTITRQVSVRQ